MIYGESHMVMFLPFLIALIAAISTFAGKKKLSYSLWLILLVVTIFWFRHHATDVLSLSF
ncbi:DUF5993 family protein [Yersinia sp. Marseille-Q3913]|uniref:DUF5993 family protein n=1 Tax=Yersinia sp. Marseille-Q3913 TaxID=2830769 RepID=UPI00403FF76A